ncbi:hypothetical protein AAW51_2888 [Caldimonas brevitalea]|uniref:VIT family protein n=2 Tax=Caldimonas brevitalea TaxID=413882 RepID=A0A0G3BJF0_9BURK|nr:hypothetical protein AAW51_2888 [Caldimonas brevitalea]
MNWADRVGEIAIGLLVTLMFTGAFAVLGSPRGAIGLSALSASTAWSLICGVMYWRGLCLRRGWQQRFQRDLQQSADDRGFVDGLSEELPASLVKSLSPAELARLRAQLPDLAPPTTSGLDVVGAVQTFVVVFCGTFPVALPLWWIADASLALGVTHAATVVLLFVAGLFLGRRSSSGRAAVLGCALAGLGALLAALCRLLQGW